ncbi:MAG: retron-type reverse transcriptase, partial [Akkermansiaceae bacterium]
MLDPIFDPGMSERSYGFRRKRSAHDAVKAAQGYVHEGKTWVVDLDIKAFFDHVNHGERSAQRIYESIVKWIGKVLRLE